MAGKPRSAPRSLREAHRDLTRARIRDAARDVFFEQHYSTTTMEQIAKAAGLTRSTLYLHYKEKAEILAAIAADYAPRAITLMGQLEGPVPTLSDLEAWIRKVVDFVYIEKTPISLFMETSQERPEPAVEGMMMDVLNALGRKIPAFRLPTDSQERRFTAHAHGFVLLNMLTYACNYALNGNSLELAQSQIRVVASYFHQFIVSHSDSGSN